MRIKDKFRKLYNQSKRKEETLRRSLKKRNLNPKKRRQIYRSIRKMKFKQKYAERSIEKRNDYYA